MTTIRATESIGWWCKLFFYPTVSFPGTQNIKNDIRCILSRIGYFLSKTRNLLIAALKSSVSERLVGSSRRNNPKSSVVAAVALALE